MKLAAPRLAFLFALLPLLATGCGLQLDAEPDPNANTCSANADCGSDGACVSIQTEQTRCVATSADLGGVILEVRPTGSDASYVFFDAVNVAGNNQNGLLQDLDLVLPETVPVTGTVEAPAGLSEACTGADGSLPVDITLIRQVEFGAFASRYEIPSPLSLDADVAASFAAAVPPGSYDMYLRPHALPSCVEVLPAPQLVMNLTVEAGTPFDFVADDMSEAAELAGTVTVPNNIGEQLDGWVLEVLDPTYGYVISNQFALAAPNEVGVVQIESFFYHPTANALLRLRDLNGNLSVHWALEALDLNSDGIVDLSLGDLVADTHTFSASVVDSSGAAVQSAAVIVQSLALTGSANQNANYRVDTRTDDAGKVSVSLVEGKYSVTIVPDVPGDATYFGEWVVVAPEPGEQFGKGKAFELVVQPVVSGSVSDPLGSLLPSAPITVGPSHQVTSSYFTRALVDPQPLKRQFSTSTLADGSFDLSVDPGDVDIAVQMPADSGYPWSVLPSIKVDEAELKPLLDVGEIQLRYPAMLQGYVKNSGAALSYAQVRAWVRGGAGDGPLIQVGSAIAGADGGYVLPLPPGITIAESTPAPKDGP